MGISVNALWTNSYHYVKGKLTNGLSPLEKKVAIVVAACFAAAAICYALYRCFCRVDVAPVDTRPKAAVVDVPPVVDVTPKDEPVAPDVGALEPNPTPMIDPAVDQAPVPIKKKLTVQESLEKNRQYAFQQQKESKPKGFTIAEADIRSLVGQFLIEGNTVKTAGIADIGRAACVGRRGEMQDADRCTSGIIKLKDASYPIKYFGVFDGHGNNGRKAANHARNGFEDSLRRLLEHHCYDGLTDEGIKRAFKECFQNLHNSYDEHDERIKSLLKEFDIADDDQAGTTMALGVILDGRLWVANVGDSRTIIVAKDGSTTQASEDAKPDILRYKDKIERLGGFVLRNRVSGRLAVATAIGDKHLKGKDGKCVILPHPKVTSYPLDSFEYLVLACDGLYDVASTDEVGLAIHCMKEADLTAERMAKRLVWGALANGSHDNITVLVIKP